MQRFGARSLWLLCLAVALVVATLHVLTAGPRRTRLAALDLPQSKQETPSTAVGV
jgi:hypothetical protein